jgi:AraC-like DNA-binding protein
VPDLAAPLEVEEIRLSPGQEWDVRADQWRFILMKRGSAYWLETSKPRELAPGELLVVSQGSPGLIRASQLSEVVLHWFAFRPGSIIGFLSVAEREWIEMHSAAALGFVASFPSTHPLVAEMANLRDSSSGENPVVRRAMALLLAFRLVTQAMPRLRPDNHRAGAAGQLFDQIISRMPDADLIQHSSEELARLCGCTPRHFNRLFRARFGTPTRVRQTELRLVKARHLLESSSTPVAQVAAECGYNSLGLFTSLFRRRFGMTPLEWREKIAG